MRRIWRLFEQIYFFQHMKMMYKVPLILILRQELFVVTEYIPMTVSIRLSRFVLRLMEMQYCFPMNLREYFRSRIGSF